MMTDPEFNCSVSEGLGSVSVLEESDNGENRNDETTNNGSMPELEDQCDKTMQEMLSKMLEQILHSNNKSMEEMSDRTIKQIEELTTKLDDNEKKLDKVGGNMKESLTELNNKFEQLHDSMREVIERIDESINGAELK
ncbi:MAG: hypothetical protein ACFYJB_01415 [Candidatus Karelsulcia muelleri]